MNVAVQPSVAKACATRNQIDSVYAGWGRSEGVRSIKEGGNVETLVCDTAGRTVPRGNRLTWSMYPLVALRSRQPRVVTVQGAEVHMQLCRGQRRKSR